MTKKIRVKIAGQERIVDVEIGQQTTAGEILSKIGCTEDYELSLGVGVAPFGKDEVVFDKTQEGNKLIASLPAIVG